MEDEKLDDESEEVPEVVDGEANGELAKFDCNGHNETDETSYTNRIMAVFPLIGKNVQGPFGNADFYRNRNLVADKKATEDQTVVEMVEEGLEETEL